MGINNIVFLTLTSAAILTAQISAAREMLAKALIADDLASVQDLLSSGVDPNLPDPYGQTALSVAILYRNARAVDLLLGRHADPNAPLRRNNQQSMVPLQLVAREGDPWVARALLSAGARIDDKGGTGQTPLHYAVQTDRLEMIRFLLDKGADVNARDSEGASPLDDAVWRKSLDAVAILLARGAKLNDPDPHTGATPLNEAAFRGDARIVSFLLQFHPDVSMPDKNGHDPFANALRMKNETCALALLDAEPKERLTTEFFGNTMETAVLRNEALVVEALLKRGVPVDSRLPSGLTALSAAASSGSAAVAVSLLNNHADPNLASPGGATPLGDAALKGFENVVSLLLDHGARIDQINSDSGATAVYAAASFGRGEVVNLLLDHGANPNLCGPNRKTPLQAAVANGYSQIAERIRNHGGREQCSQ
jgi:ankyrin repeat protein